MYRRNGRNRGGEILRVNFARLPLLAAVAVMAAMAAALWLAPAAPPVAQAQEAVADCGGAGNPLHGRTQKVVDAILGKLSETDCSAVTSTQLAGITGDLVLRSQSLSSLQSDDFDGLSGLGTLYLGDNSLSSLPEDVFDGLSSLQELALNNNPLTTVSADLFDGLSNLQELALNTNRLTALPEDVFDGLSGLQELHLDSTRQTALPSNLFDGLTSLRELSLHNNSLLEALPSDLFDGLTSLRDLDLHNNSLLTCVHAGQFDGLSELRILYLPGAQLGNINPVHFDQWSLDQLETLEFGGNLIAGTTIDFQQYKNVLPALVEGNTRVHDADGLSSPICASSEAETDGSGFHTSVTVRLPHSLVYPNRARVSDAAMLGDGVCGSDAAATRHELWTWQRSADGITWADMDAARQPPDYGTRTAGQCSYTYTPQTDDNTMYVRAYVPVTTTGITDAQNYHSAVFGPLNVQ